MKVKRGVKLSDLKIEMRKVLMVAERIWNELGKEVVVTSTGDGVHSAASFHPYGWAIDFRTRYFNRDKQNIAANRLREELGPLYDVVLEKDHMHVEYDPESAVAAVEIGEVKEA